MDLQWWQWALLVVAAGVVGLSKTGLPGAATIAVVVFAAIFPARMSTATLLVLFLVGDAFALWAYRRHGNWRVLLRLAPAVVVGVLLGALFLAFASDSWTRRMIGIILLLVVGFTLWRRYGRALDSEPAAEPHPVATAAYGSLGGFTTMVANAGGPVMSMYFLAARFPVQAFLGTTAWFFGLVNVIKLPFAIGLGLLTPAGLAADAVLAPAVIGGAFLGRFLARRVSQIVFERLVILLTIAGAVYLLI